MCHEGLEMLLRVYFYRARYHGQRRLAHATSPLSTYMPEAGAIFLAASRTNRQDSFIINRRRCHNRLSWPQLALFRSRSPNPTHRFVGSIRPERDWENKVLAQEPCQYEEFLRLFYQRPALTHFLRRGEKNALKKKMRVAVSTMVAPEAVSSR